MPEPQTLQDYFDIAWDHAVVKKSPQASDNDGNCQYRTPEGNKCLIGAGIPDELYNPSIETLLAHEALAICGMTVPDKEAINDLQCCHDYCQGLGYSDQVLLRLKHFARKHHLNIPN